MNLFIVIGYKGKDVAQVVGDINENLTEAKAVLADNVEDYNKLEIWSRNQGCVREKKLSSRENLKLIVVQKNKGKINRAEAKTEPIEAQEAEATAEVVAEVEAVEQSETSTVAEEPTQEAETAEVVEAEAAVVTKATAKAKNSAKSTKTSK